MHQSVQKFVKDSLHREDVADKRVLEVGSYDVNGSVRPYIASLNPTQYLGVDIEDGPSVDQVANCERLTQYVGTGWDVVITTEMLEHVRDWAACMTELGAALAEGGLLIVTTRSPGFFYHPHPEDNWRFTPAVMQRILDTLHLKTLCLIDDPEAPGVFALAKKADVRSILEGIPVGKPVK